MEQTLTEQGWPRLTIARPAMLIGERKKRRVNESLFAPLFRLLPGDWKSIEARDVASAMLNTAFSPMTEQVTVLSSSELRQRAND